VESEVETTQETLPRGGTVPSTTYREGNRTCWGGVERESEGPMVVEILVQQNARGATGPCFT